jgi:hypothetical protein
MRIEYTAHRAEIKRGVRRGDRGRGEDARKGERGERRGGDEARSEARRRGEREGEGERREARGGERRETQEQTARKKEHRKTAYANNETRANKETIWRFAFRIFAGAGNGVIESERKA